MYKYFRLGVVSVEGNVTLPTVDIRARSMDATGRVRRPAARDRLRAEGRDLSRDYQPPRAGSSVRFLLEQEGKASLRRRREIRLLCKRLRFDIDPALEERLNVASRLRAPENSENRAGVLGVLPARQYRRALPQGPASGGSTSPHLATTAARLRRERDRPPQREGCGAEALQRVSGRLDTWSWCSPPTRRRPCGGACGAST
jgi:hypothetical protein